MNVRLALVLLVLGFVGLLLVMGALSFVRWLKVTNPRHYRLILVGLCVALIGLSVWGIMLVVDRPSFEPGDLITVQEPMVARMVATDLKAPTASCIVEGYENLSVVGVSSGTLKARVESSKMSGPAFCPVGAVVELELAWLHRYTSTHRQLGPS